MGRIAMPGCYARNTPRPQLTVPHILETEDARGSEVVIAMGCGGTYSISSGKCCEDWELAHPAGQPNEVVRQVRDDIRGRLDELIAELTER